MKTERLLYSIGMIDDKFIEEAAPVGISSSVSKPSKKLIGIWRFVPIAACFVIIAAVILIFGQNNVSKPPNENILWPEQIEQDSEYAGEVPEKIYSEQTGINDEQVGQEAEDNLKIYPLALNKSDICIAASFFIPGHFWYGLTDRQLDVIFPNFPFSISATAHYSGDGSLFNVTAFETGGQQGSDGIAKYNEHYIMTEIQISHDEIMEDVIYEYKTETSDVHGVSVTAGMYGGNVNNGAALYTASFKLESIYYYIKLYDSENGDSGVNRLTTIVNYIVVGGAADLSVLSNPVIPELRDEQITLDEARYDTTFGEYVPGSIPFGYKLESARRFINQAENSLNISWTKGYGYISWYISAPTEYDKKHIVSAKDREKYDMSLYTIPHSDSVPSEIREYVDNPVFIAEELTIDIVRARAYQVEDKGDISGPRMRFGVLYGNVLVSVGVKGVSSEEVYNMLQEIYAMKR